MGLVKDQSTAQFNGIRLHNVCNMFGTSPATIWRWSKSSYGFPKPIQLSGGVTVWDEGELLDWIESKKSERGMN